MSEIDDELEASMERGQQVIDLHVDLDVLIERAEAVLDYFKTYQSPNHSPGAVHLGNLQATVDYLRQKHRKPREPQA